MSGTSGAAACSGRSRLFCANTAEENKRAAPRLTSLDLKNLDICPLCNQRLLFFLELSKIAKGGDVKRESGRPDASALAHFHLDGPFRAAVDELLDKRIAARVDLRCRSLPEDSALVDHRNFIGDFARRCHVVSN